MSYIEGKWNCSHCGHKRIEARLTVCPNCDDDRDDVFTRRGDIDSERVYFEDGELSVTDAEGLRLARSGRNWTCGACGKVNRGTTTVCTREGCGKELDEDDFVNSVTTYVGTPGDADGEPISTPGDLDQDRVAAILASNGPELILSGEPAKFADRTLLGDLPQDPNRKKSGGKQSPPRNNFMPFGGFIGSHLKFILWAVVGTVVTIALIVGGILVFSTKTVAVTVTATQWERSVETEELITLTNEGWWDELPSDAVEVSRSEKKRDTKKEYSHTETRTTEQTSQKSVGESTEEYACGTKKVDLGNGFAENRTKYCDHKVTEYKDVVVKQTYTTDIYDDVPVYDDWVTYRVKRWVTAFYTYADSTKEPYWPTPIVNRSNQRAGDDRRENYSVTVADQDGKSYTVNTSSYGSWSRLHVGSETTGEVNTFGSMLSINWS
ncbi:MAG: hypothetical protein WBP12_01440 [Candidatus Saccharimonas sp.]